MKKYFITSTLFFCLTVCSFGQTACGFEYKKEIVLQASQVSGSGSHTDFPVLISEVDADLRHTGSGGKVENINGYDIIFYDDNSNALEHQIEEYVSTTGEFVAWVKIPSLSTSTNTTIHMLYGNSSLTTDPSTTNVWGANYHSVWHLNNDFLDYTANGYDGTNNGSNDNTTSKIADGQNFVDPNNWIETPTFPNMSTDFTISGWIRTVDNTQAGQRVFCDDANNSSGGYALSLGDGGTGRLRFYIRGLAPVILDSPLNVISNNTWHYCVAVMDVTNTMKYLYVDGALVASQSYSNALGSDAGNAAIGGEVAIGETANRFDGDLDEIRVAASALSADWIATQYNAQNSPSGTFYIVGAEEDIYLTTVSDGDWDDVTIWDGTNIPNDDFATVIINHNVDVDGGSADYTACTCEINGDGTQNAYLDISSTRILTIREDLDANFTGAGAFDTRLHMTNNSQLIVEGNMTWNSTNTNTGSDLRINMRNNSVIDLSGSLTSSIAGGDDLLLDLQNDADFNIGGNLSYTHDGGDLIRIDLDDAARIDLSGDFNITQNAGDDVYVRMNNASGTSAQINVGGDFNITQDGGDDIFFELDSANSTIAITGDLNIDDNGGDDITFDFFGSNSNLTIQGAMVVDLTSVDDDDITFNLDEGSLTVTGSSSISRSADAHEVLFDLDGGDYTTGGLTLNNSGTDDVDHSIWFNVDEASTMTVNGNVQINVTGGNNIQLYINNSIGNDGTIDVNGNFNIDQDAGSNVYMYAVGTNSNFDISGSLLIDHDGGELNEIRVDGSNAMFNVGTTATIQWDGGTDSEFEVDLNDGTMTVGGLFTGSRSADTGPLDFNLDGGNFNANSGMTFTSAGILNNNGAITFDIDESSIFTCTGALSATMSGGDDFRVGVNVNGGTGAQFNCTGNFTINRSDGDDIEFFSDDDNSIIHIGGNLNITSTGGEEVLFDLDNDGTIDIDGNVTIDYSEGQDCEIDLEFNAGNADPLFNVDGDFTLNLTAGNDEWLFDLNGGTFQIDGEMDLNNTGSGGSEDILIEIDEDAIMNVDGDLTMVLSGGDDLSIELGNNSTNSTAQLNVGIDLRLDHNGSIGGDDMFINFRDNTRGTVDDDLILDSDFVGNDLLFVRLNTTSELTVGDDIEFYAATDGKTELEINNSAILHIAGNFVRQNSPNDFGVLDCNNTATVEYNGTGASQEFAQDAGQGADEFDYQNVIINNTFGISPQLTMEGLATVHTGITFTDGVIASTVANLLVIDDNATSAGASDISHVDGEVRKVGNEAFTFPVGDDDNYQPIAISAPALTTDHFTARYNEIDPDPPYDDSSLVGSIHHVSSCEYWILDRTNGSSNVDVTLAWDGNSCIVNDMPNLLVARWDGSQWQDEGNGGTTGNNAAGTVVSSAPVTNFSPFTLASYTSSNPLPIELVLFTGRNDGAVNILSWETVSEINNDYFTVERSTDGENFMEVGTVTGAGNSNTLLNYELIDDAPIKGVNYYRLKQTDFDGRFTYSSIIAINVSINAEIEIYPNPADDYFVVNFNGTNKELMSLSITNIAGQVVRQQQIYATGLQKINTNQLPKGVYMVSITSESINLTQRLVVK